MADIDDVRTEIDEALSEAAEAVSSAVTEPPRPRTSKPVLAAAAGLIGLLLAGTVTAIWLLLRDGQRTLLTQRVSIPLDAGRQIALGPSTALALSPDGRRLVYAARAASQTQLFLHKFDQFDAIAVAGSQGASAPFFSHDGEWVGFFAGDALQKVTLHGGAPLRICDAPSLLSASWGQDGTIVFATAFAGDGLWRVTADGGVPEQLTKPDIAKGELHHAYPQVLADGKHIIFTVVSAAASYPALLTTSAQRWQTVPQIRFESGGAQDLPTGHLLYAHAGQLVVVPFDLGRGESTGPSLPLREPMEGNPESGGHFAVASAGTGSLVYVPARTSLSADTLVLVDREGRTAPLLETRSSVLAAPVLARWTTTCRDDRCRGRERRVGLRPAAQDTDSPYRGRCQWFAKLVTRRPAGDLSRSALRTLDAAFASGRRQREVRAGSNDAVAGTACGGLSGSRQAVARYPPNAVRRESTVSGVMGE